MEVTEKIFKQYKEIQLSDECNFNMMNKTAVQSEAHKRDFHQLVVFLESLDRVEYMDNFLSNYDKYEEKFDE